MPPKTVQKFALVHQSYEDLNYDGKAVLAKESVLQHQFRRKGPVVQFEEDMLAEELEEERHNLQVVDDAKEGRIFEDEVEEDFDEDFIRQMMTGEGVAGFEDDSDDDNAAAAAGRVYPKHEDKGAQEKQFDKMMAEFDMDEDIQEEDPRVRGALPVEQYGSTLEQFVSENAGSSYMSEEPTTHKGLIQQLSLLARNNPGLALPNQEVLTVTDRRSQDVSEFMQTAEELRNQMRDALQKSQLNEADVTVAERVARAVQAAIQPDGTIAPIDEMQDRRTNLPPEVVKFMDDVDRRTQREDCETALTTLTSTFNLPNVIAVPKGTKRLKPSRHTHHLVAENQRARKKKMEEGGDDDEVVEPKQQQQQQQQARRPHEINAAGDDDEEEEDDMMMYDDPDDVNAMLKQQRVALSAVPTDETPEQKKARKQMVKQMQRDARATKKMLKQEFAKTTTTQTNSIKASQRDKATATLSSIRGNMVNS